jgi:hypothetical protein
MGIKLGFFALREKRRFEAMIIETEWKAYRDERGKVT